LRRENTWLKEIVMLKGRSLASTSKPPEGHTPEDMGKVDTPEPSDGEEGSESKKGKGKAKKGKGRKT
jgi:hypothetical protein